MIAQTLDEMPEVELARYLINHTIYQITDVVFEHSVGVFEARDNGFFGQSDRPIYADMTNIDHIDLDHEITYTITYQCGFCEYDFYEYVDEDYQNNNYRGDHEPLFRNKEDRLWLGDYTDFLKLWEVNEDYREHMTEHLELLLWLDRNPFYEPFTNGSVTIKCRPDKVYRSEGFIAAGFEYVGDINRLFTMHKLFKEDDPVRSVKRLGGTLGDLARVFREVEIMYGN